LQLFVVLGQECVSPGVSPPDVCAPPPAAKYSNVTDIPGRMQWLDRDGYCGSNSIQMVALSYGAWISQDLVRKSVGNHEILHTNIQQAITTLKFMLNSWQYSSYPIPQYVQYLTWLKGHLVKREPVIWFIYCQGDSHGPHGGDGYYDHIEPVFGIWSNYSLSDPNWYADDVLVHHSDWDQNNYYRPFSTLQDNASMQGNCAVSPSGGGKNEMYPCIPSDNYDYGYSMTGVVDPKNIAVPLALYVDDWQEPDLDEGEKPEWFNGTLQLSGLKSGMNYIIYRWDDANKCPGCPGGQYYPSIPSDSNYANSTYSYSHPFTATGPSYTWKDPVSFISSGATYYRCVPAMSETAGIAVW